MRETLKLLFLGFVGALVISFVGGFVEAASRDLFPNLAPYIHDLDKYALGVFVGILIGRDW